MSTERHGDCCRGRGPVRFLVGLCVVGVAGIASAQPEPNPNAPPPDAPAPGAPAPDAPPPAPTQAPSGATQTIRGRVINALGRPVRNAKVSIEGEAAQVTTDKAGWFRIEAPIGATLVIEADGYEVGLSTVDKVTLDDSVLLTTAQTSETIEVSGDAPPPVAGAAKLDRQELQRVPGTGGDLVRTLTVMPGVVK